jgi:hypothetical protein
VPFFVPQEHPQPLPQPGSAIERAVMDWKVVADGTDFHKAKDVAAFANHLGGTLLIGAKETDGQLERYVGMNPADAGSVRDKFSKAVKDRCEPLPRIDFGEYNDPNDVTKKVVAVNVWPSLLLIGVRLATHKPSEDYGGNSYVYPVRAGTDADYLTPSQIAMYMTPQVRRVAVLISRIPKGSLITIWNSRNHQYNALYQELKEDQNLVMFTSQDGSRAPNLPLDCIRTVYEAWEPTRQQIYWRMHLDDGLG